MKIQYVINTLNNADNMNEIKQKEVNKMADLIPHGNDKRNNIWGWNIAPWFNNFWNDDLIENFWANTMAPMAGFGRGFRADVRENEKEYIVEAELPGVDKNQIDVHLENDILTISAKQSNVTNEEKHNYIRRERSFGEFRRSFMLENVREEGVTAEYNNGILKVTLPKKIEGKARGRKIDIH